MNTIIECYKKVFANKKANLWLFIICTVLCLCSIAFDFAIGKPNTMRQNIFDITINLFIGFYSIQFIHNVIYNINGGLLPSFKDVEWKNIWKMIVLNIIWGLYAVLALLIALIGYLITHTIITPIIIGILSLFFGMFIYYIYLSFADDFTTNNLFKITSLFKCVKPGFKALYINLFLFTLISIGIIIIYAVLYLLLSFIGADITIFQDYNIIDVLLLPILLYSIIITWFFVFPCTLINTYIQDIRPLLRGELVQNGTHD